VRSKEKRGVLGMEQLELLWYLQEKDLAILEQEKALESHPLIGETKELEKKLQTENSRLEKIKNELGNKQKETKKIDLNLQQANDEIKTLRKKLYGGEVSKLKELEQMEKKLELVEKNKEQMEHQIIEEMENQEELEEMYSKQKEVVKRQEEEVNAKRQERDQKLYEIKQNIEKLKAEREEIASQIEKQYMEKYQKLRRSLGKRGLSRVVNDICEGCRVFISSAQRGALYNPKAMVYCENCGRLLVKFREDLEKEKSS